MRYIRYSSSTVRWASTLPALCGGMACIAGDSAAVGFCDLCIVLFQSLWDIRNGKVPSEVGKVVQLVGIFLCQVVEVAVAHLAVAVGLS